jgi:hypothetical protein
MGGKWKDRYEMEAEKLRQCRAELLNLQQKYNSLLATQESNE